MLQFLPPEVSGMVFTHVTTTTPWAPTVIPRNSFLFIPWIFCEKLLPAIALILVPLRASSSSFLYKYASTSHPGAVIPGAQTPYRPQTNACTLIFSESLLAHLQIQSKQRSVFVVVFAYLFCFPLWSCSGYTQVSFWHYQIKHQAALWYYTEEFFSIVLNFFLPHCIIKSLQILFSSRFACYFSVLWQIIPGWRNLHFGPNFQLLNDSINSVTCIVSTYEWLSFLWLQFKGIYSHICSWRRLFVLSVLHGPDKGVITSLHGTYFSCRSINCELLDGETYAFIDRYWQKPIQTIHFEFDHWI